MVARAGWRSCRSGAGRWSVRCSPTTTCGYADISEALDLPPGQHRPDGEGAGAAQHCGAPWEHVGLDAESA